MSHDQSAMQPTRDPGATLPDLLEVLLNKGVHLNLDLIISVADIPLIGVNLRATIAGIETMLEYGMMRQWDEQTRAWVQKSVSQHLSLAEDEELIAAMAASHYQEGFHRTWRPGRAYLTTKRLIVHRRDPAETLWQAALSTIDTAESLPETSVGGETRTRLRIVLQDGTETKLSAADPEQLLKLVRRQLHHPEVPSASQGSPREPGPRMEGNVWYLEELANTRTWRGGRAALEDQGQFTWQSPLDSRASIRIRSADVQSIGLENRSNPTDNAQVLRIEMPGSTLRLAAAQLQQWQQHLSEWSGSSKEALNGTSGR